MAHPNEYTPGVLSHRANHENESAGDQRGQTRFTARGSVQCVWECAFMCVCMCVCMCMRVCMSVCMRARAYGACARHLRWSSTMKSVAAAIPSSLSNAVAVSSARLQEKVHVIM